MLPCEAVTRPSEVKWSEVKVSVVFDFLQPQGLCSPGNSPGQNTGVGSLSLLQGIFLTQGSNPRLLHCRQILYQLSHKGSPRVLEWVAYPFSSGSSRPRNRTGIFGIAGRFFTNWIIREALSPWHCHLILTACATDLVLRGQPSPHTWFSFLPQSGSSLSDIHNKPGAPGHLMLSLRTLLLHTISQPDSSPSYRCRAEALGWGTCEGHIDRTKGDWDKHSHVSGFKAFISFVLI